MAIPKFEETMYPILKLMSDGKGRTNKEIKIELVKNMNISQQDLSIRNNNGNIKFYDNCGFAISYIQMAGLLDRPKRNYYIISEAGKKELESSDGKIDVARLKEINPDFQNRLLGHVNSRKKDNNQANEVDNNELTPTEVIDENISIIKNSVSEEVLEYLKQGSPSFFEKVCKDLLIKMGYGDEGEVTPQSRDNGIDSIIYADKLGLEKIMVQSKRYTTGSVQRPELQGFKGAIGNNKGVFITTSRFSQGAIEFANLNNIRLIDGEELVDLMYKYGVGVRVVYNYEIKAIDKDYFDEL